MPPQQTNVTSLTRRDAARPRLTIALVKNATGDAFAEARPDASIATLRDAFSEKEAAGPPVASTRSVLERSVLDLLRDYWRALRERHQRERLRVSLRDLSERALMDIGVPQGDIEHIVANQAIERLRDGTAYQWLSRGLM
ncbi:hypothetical protein UP09_34370 [Bradyrhizobium sp. LTSP885]|uniref:hypothetical protein n=1 Tax=Bradyrhizobium sp. LTSP885 TaxID=1619232 RepID=UPI0005C8E86E|nr:hypothetical protein [Bradyrhizobium sp. LTSP885]KJC33571.1 hypothetical protein UP09_34370 [Bradyrhizobium sp. LTSP885]